MASTTTIDTVRTRLPSKRQALWIVLAINAQLVVAVLYYAVTDASMTTLTTVQNSLYGLVWLNVSAIVLWKVRPPAGYDFETRRRAVTIAAVYFAVLLGLGGIVSTGVPAHLTDLRVAWLPIGWGPAVVVAGQHLTLVLVPAYLLGYVALSYLVYLTVLEASGSVVAGVLGLLSCVSCTLPILAFVASSLLGGTTILAASALDLSYGLSTAVFLVTVALLYWRPGFR